MGAPGAAVASGGGTSFPSKGAGGGGGSGGGVGGGRGGVGGGGGMIGAGGELPLGGGGGSAGLSGGFGGFSGGGAMIVSSMMRTSPSGLDPAPVLSEAALFTSSMLLSTLTRLQPFARGPLRISGFDGEIIPSFFVDLFQDHGNNVSDLHGV